MDLALRGMLDRYRPRTLADHQNALTEIVQELALLGLWRAKFFEHAAFYGGTALRIFHSLPRSSEDLDFLCCDLTGQSTWHPTWKRSARSWRHSGSAFASSGGPSG